MTKTLTLAAIATAFATSAFAMVPSNDSIKEDIIDLGFSAAEVAQIPASDLGYLKWSLNNGDDRDARQAVRSVIASSIYEGGVSAEEFAAWNASNGENSDYTPVEGVDFTSNGADFAAVQNLLATSGDDADQRRFAN